VSRTATAAALAEPCLHRPARSRSGAALRWALAVTATFAVVEVVGGLLAGSLALLADAGHMVTDAASLGLSLFAAWIAARPADANRTYGWYRVEILAALVNGATLLAVTAWIVVEAIQRLRTPQPVQPALMLGVASAGLVANLVGVVLLHRAKGESLNVHGAYLHVLSDVLGSVAAVTAGVIIALTGWTPADPLMSLGLSVLLLMSASRLVLRSADVLLEAAPRHVRVADLEAAIRAVPGVEGVHDLHVWTVSDGMVAMSAHACVEDPADHQAALEAIHGTARAHGIQHVTVQMERACAAAAPPVTLPRP
jgi:cobalt-zinc-cadmium efflux system protein